MKDRKKVYNAYKQQCKAKLDKVDTLVAQLTSPRAVVIPDDLERLRDLNKALKEQWGHMEGLWDETMAKYVED